MGGAAGHAVAKRRGGAQAQNVGAGGKQAVTRHRPAIVGVIMTARAGFVQPAGGDGEAGDALVRHMDGRRSIRLRAAVIAQGGNHDAPGAGSLLHRAPDHGNPAGLSPTHVQDVGTSLGSGLVGSVSPRQSGGGSDVSGGRINGGCLRCRHPANADQVGVVGDAVNAVAIPARRDDAGHVGAVDVVNSAVVESPGHIDLRMRRVDAGVDHGHGDATATGPAGDAPGVSFGGVDQVQLVCAGACADRGGAAVLTGLPRRRQPRAGWL